MESDEPKIKSKQALKEIELCVNNTSYYGVQNVNNGGLVLGLDFCINLTSTTYIKNCREHKICQTLT